MNQEQLQDFNKSVDERIKKVLPQYLQTSAFMARKLSDTPTDQFQMVPKKYVDTAISSTVSGSSILDIQITFSDNTTGNSSTSAHGFLKKLSNSATDFFDGTGNWDTVKDSDLSLSDITTNDVSTSQHGFTPKAPNSTTQ